NAAGVLYLGYNAGSTGSYNLGGGTLSMNSGVEYIGDQGMGNFTQTSGTNSNNLEIIGTYAGSNGTYVQSGGSNNVSGAEIIGRDAGSAGTYIQSGGNNSSTGGLEIAR